MNSPTSWDDFRIVKAISDQQSLVGAAESLGLNHSTVFRRLGALEATLKTRIFERSRNGYTPTAAGERMVALAEQMANDINGFQLKCAGRDVQPSGELRVTTNDTMLVHLLTPIFAGFTKTYPDIRLDIVVSNAALNLSKRDADIAIRATANPPETLVGRNIGPIAWAEYAANSLVKQNAVPDRASARWVGYGDNLSGLMANRQLEHKFENQQIVYRVNTVLGLAEAVAANIGLGYLPCFIGDKIPGITRVSMPLPEPSSHLWLLTHPELREAARVRVFMTYVGGELTKQRRFLDGTADVKSASQPVSLASAAIMN